MTVRPSSAATLVIANGIARWPGEGDDARFIPPSAQRKPTGTSQSGIPATKLVKLTEVPKYMPRGALFVTTDQRKAILDQRRTALPHRYGY